MSAFTVLLAASALGLFLVWGVYPLLIGVLGAARRQATPALPSLAPRVSVVIATREVAEVVERRVRDVLAGDYDAGLVEIVVAVDARAAGQLVPQLAARLAALPVRVVAGDAPGGKAAALNAAMRAATGDVLVFTDSYQSFDRAAIPRLVAAACAPGVGIVSGRLALAGTSSAGPIRAYWAYETWLREQECRVHSSPGVFGPVCAMRRALWAPLPPDLILDDAWTPMRLVLEGWRVGFARDAVAHDLRPPQPGQEFKRKVRTLTGVLQLCAWLPAILVPWRNPIWLQFYWHKLGRLLTPYFVLGMAAGIAGLAVQLAARAWLPTVATSATVGAVVALTPAARRKARSLVTWGVSIQLAAVLAAANGARGRWNVWQR